MQHAEVKLKCKCSYQVPSVAWSRSRHPYKCLLVFILKHSCDCLLSCLIFLTHFYLFPEGCSVFLFFKFKHINEIKGLISAVHYRCCYVNTVFKSRGMLSRERGLHYHGTVSFTVMGKKYQAWNLVMPHRHNRTARDFPNVYVSFALCVMLASCSCFPCSCLTVLKSRRECPW